MTLADHLPSVLKRKPWSWLVVAFVVLFFLDDVLIGLFGAFLIGGLLGVAVVLVLAAVIMTRTDWGRRRWRRTKRFLTNS